MFHVNLHGSIIQPKTPTDPRPCRAQHHEPHATVGGKAQVLLQRKIHDLRGEVPVLSGAWPKLLG